MSYARFGWGGSDVYVFFNTGGYYECCFCALQDREFIKDEGDSFWGGYFRNVGEEIETQFDSAEEMVDHLMLHRGAGHYVPQDCIDALLDPEDQKQCRSWRENRG